jgi:hypothetical protein
MATRYRICNRKNCLHKRKNGRCGLWNFEPKDESRCGNYKKKNIKK